MRAYMFGIACLAPRGVMTRVGGGAPTVGLIAASHQAGEENKAVASKHGAPFIFNGVTTATFPCFSIAGLLLKVSLVDEDICNFSKHGASRVVKELSEGGRPPDPCTPASRPRGPEEPLCW